MIRQHTRGLRRMHRWLACFCLAALFCTQAIADRTEPGQTAAQPLVAGKLIEGRLVAGEAQSYLITLAANQYVRVSVKPQPINVAVTVVAPDGKPISRFDHSTPEAEPVSIVTTVAGEHRLEVRATATGTDNGRYEVRLDEARPATPQDRKDVAARRHAEADRLGRQHTAQARRWATEKYREALALWAADETAQR